MGSDGLPAALIWAMVDDYLIHGPTTRKCYEAFTVFMSYMVRLGFICQKVKTSPPEQVQTFCGLLFGTQAAPKIKIPEDKISRAKASIEFIKLVDQQDRLSRLSASIVGGLLQSLVEATPS
jgi:hypothetical protein